MDEWRGLHQVITTVDPQDDPVPGAGCCEGDPGSRTVTCLIRQWSRDDSRIVRLLLIPSVTEDRQAGPFVRMLTGLHPNELASLDLAWSETQRASDATPLGRAARPVVGLMPAAFRWTVVRIMGATAFTLEPLSFTEPVAALSAAEQRFRMLVRAASAHGIPRADPEPISTPPAPNDREGA